MYIYSGAAVGAAGVVVSRLADQLPVSDPSTLIRTSLHHEHDSASGIGAIPSEMRLTAPMLWGRIVFMMNSRRD